MNEAISRSVSAQIRAYYEFDHWWIECMRYHGSMLASTHLHCHNLSESQVNELVEQLKECSAIGNFCVMDAR